MATQPENMQPENMAEMEVQRGEAKTPMKDLNHEFPTPIAKTPKSRRRRSLSRSPWTPTSCEDRFIPNRAAMEFDLSHHLVMKSEREREESSEDMEVEEITPYQAEYQRVMSETLNGRDISKAKVLNFGPKKSRSLTCEEQLRTMYSSEKKRRMLRVIPQAPEQCLDAPEIINDYYLNTLDWSAKNLMAVGLGKVVYLWDASKRETSELMRVENRDNYICSVSWGFQGTYLAVGTAMGRVELWDVETKKQIRNMVGHSSRVNALSWNSDMLSSGDLHGWVHHHDVRQSKHLVAEIKAHKDEVCGLRWSPNGRYLASGGNDNLLNIWSAPLATSNRPTLTFSEHTAAVKAVAWCPWNPNRLASGGGSKDQHIRLWNCCKGEQYGCVNTESQVCCILWSEEYQELISGHGPPDNQLAIWKHPSLSKVTDLKAHTGRVLHMAMSPDKTTVVSAGADETLRLWKCFEVDKAKKQSRKALYSESVLLRSSIR